MTQAIFIPRTHDSNMPHEELMKLVEAGDWDAKSLYGARLTFGDGYVEQDIETGLQYVQEAYEAGAIRACITLSVYYQRLHKPEPDFEKAIYYANKVLEHDKIRGYEIFLGIEGDRGNNEKEIEYGKKLLEHNISEELRFEVYFRLGLTHANLKKYDESYQYYLKALENKDVGFWAAANINVFYLIKQKHIDKPLEEGLNHLLAAAKEIQGFYRFFEYCKTIFEHEELHHLKSKAEPMLLDMAENYNVLDACLKLTEEYRNKESEYYQPEKAFALMAHACKFQSENLDYVDLEDFYYEGVAFERYAQMREVGEGCDVDKRAAFENHIIAAEKGRNLSAVAAEKLLDTFDFSEEQIKKYWEIIRPGLEGAREYSSVNKGGHVHAALAYRFLKYNEDLGRFKYEVDLALVKGEPDIALKAASLFLKRKEPATAYAYANYAKEINGKELPEDLAVLSPRKRNILFGYTGEKIYNELLLSVEETRKEHGIESSEEAGTSNLESAG